MLAVLIACALTTATHAETKGDQFVFVGLRPMASDNGPNDIKRLAEAQAIRTVAQSALQDLSKQAVVGHDDLVRVLGARYLVSWFDCKGQLTCIMRVIAPLRNSGFKTAVTGDFFVADDGVYHLKLVAFTIADGKVSKQLSFELPGVAS